MPRAIYQARASLDRNALTTKNRGGPTRITLVTSAKYDCRYESRGSATCCSSPLQTATTLGFSFEGF